MKKGLLIYALLFLTLLGAFFLQKYNVIVDKPIVKISQLSLQKEAVSSLYLTELLGLSYDKTICRDEFDLIEARENLLSSPLIDNAEISFISPDHIQVKYYHVNPVALISDFKNVGIDKHGKLFPIRPFLSPRGLPKVFLGLEEIYEGDDIFALKEKTRWEFALKVLEELHAFNLEGNVSGIDVSKIEEKSLGKNELIISINYPQRKDILRLSKRNYLNEVSNYIILCNTLKNESGTLMIDFRFEATAFIEKFK